MRILENDPCLRVMLRILDKATRQRMYNQFFSFPSIFVVTHWGVLCRIYNDHLLWYLASIHALQPLARSVNVWASSQRCRRRSSTCDMAEAISSTSKLYGG
jgi:hypothetical protein